MSAKVDDHWGTGSPYERYVGRWSREVAPRFLAWLAPAPRRKFVDVGCGTGALCSAILENTKPALVVGVEPSPGFLDLARQHLAGRALLFKGDATSIPLDEGAVDFAVSGLVLNFVPDIPRALVEMKRVTAAGGTIAAYVWDYAGKMEMMRKFWDAAVSLDVDAGKLDEGRRFPMCKPEALTALFTDAGLAGVDVTTIDVPTVFTSFDDYWQPFTGGQGPAPAYAMSLSEEARTALRERIRERLRIRANGSIAMTARAFAVRGTVAK